MYKRILVPLDGSTLAEAVLPHVRALAQCLGAEVVLLSVPVYPVSGFTITDPALGQSLVELTRESASAYLQRVRTPLQADGLAVTSELRDGPVAETILDAAAELRVDAIAMATHGRGGFARFLLGSVADQVVQRSPLPVLLIRPHPGNPALAPAEAPTAESAHA